MIAIGMVYDRVTSASMHYTIPHSLTFCWSRTCHRQQLCERADGVKSEVARKAEHFGWRRSLKPLDHDATASVSHPSYCNFVIVTQQSWHLRVQLNFARYVILTAVMQHRSVSETFFIDRVSFSLALSLCQLSKMCSDFCGITNSE